MPEGRLGASLSNRTPRSSETGAGTDGRFSAAYQARFYNASALNRAIAPVFKL